MVKSWLFTSESVSEGHPDKVCDRISDVILDAYLREAPDDARCGIECLVTTDHVTVAGEVRGPQSVMQEVEGLIRDAIQDIGYAQPGFDYRTVKVTNLLHSQSPDIAQGVDKGSKNEEGAGDQGIMFGFACRETKELMPAPIQFAHRILRLMADERKCGIRSELGPDAKSQVTFRYEDGEPVGIDALVISTQHCEEVSNSKIREIVRKYIDQVSFEGWTVPEDRLLVNPTGRFVIGGPESDTGLTGRKIIVDTYGGAALHGGGAFSGKDPTKVDRSAAYAARYLAKNVVAAGLAEKCQIQLAYAIAVPEPIAVYVETFGTGKVDEAKLSKVLREMVRLSPRGIREHLGLQRPIYARTSAYGHFGRPTEENGAFSWESTDISEELAREFGHTIDGQ